MLHFPTIIEFKDSFLGNELDQLSENIMIGGNIFEQTYFTYNPFITNSKFRSPIVIFESMSKRESNNYLILCWERTNMSVTPLDVFFMDKNNLSENQNEIGTTVKVKFPHIGNGVSINAKVDSGATMACLHVDKIKLDEPAKKVSFVNNELSTNTVILPLIEMRQVQSSNGETENRPVVSLNVDINGMPIRNCLFNLTDRSKMEFKVLIGDDILKKGNFLINPRLKESFDINDVQTLINSL